MPIPAQLIFREQNLPLPADYRLDPGLELVLSSVVARIDGTAAAGPFVPCLGIYSQSGERMALVRTDQEFAAGDTGVVTWAPFLRHRGAAAGTQTRIGARLENLGGQTVATATDTTRNFDTVAYDTDNMADLATDDSILTVRTAGTYLVIAEANYATNANGRRISLILLNGFYGAGTGSIIAAMSLQAITDVNARTSAIAVVVYALGVGDFISTGAYQRSGGNLVEGGAGADNQSSLTMARISA